MIGNNFKQPQGAAGYLDPHYFKAMKLLGLSGADLAALLGQKGVDYLSQWRAAQGEANARKGVKNV